MRVYDRLRTVVASGDRTYILSHDADKDWYVYSLEGSPDQAHSFRVKAYAGRPGEPDHFFIRMSDKKKLWLLPATDNVDEEAAQQRAEQGVIPDTPQLSVDDRPPGASDNTQPSTPVQMPSLGTTDLPTAPVSELPSREPTPMLVDDVLPQPKTPLNAEPSPYFINQKANETVAAFCDYLRGFNLPVLAFPEEEALVAQYRDLFLSTVGRAPFAGAERAVQDECVLRMRRVHAALRNLNEEVLQAQTRVLAHQRGTHEAESPERERRARRDGVPVRVSADEQRCVEREEDLVAAYNGRLRLLCRDVSGRTLAGAAELQADELQAQQGARVAAFRAQEAELHADYVAAFARLTERRRELVVREEAAAARAAAHARDADADAERALEAAAEAAAATSPERVAADLAGRQQEFEELTDRALREQQTQLQQRFDVLFMPSALPRSGASGEALAALEAKVQRLEQMGTAAKSSLVDATDEVKRTLGCLEERERAAHTLRAESNREVSTEVESMRRQADNYIRATHAAFNRGVTELMRRARDLSFGGGGAQQRSEGGGDDEAAVDRTPATLQPSRSFARSVTPTATPASPPRASPRPPSVPQPPLLAEQLLPPSTPTPQPPASVSAASEPAALRHPATATASFASSSAAAAAPPSATSFAAAAAVVAHAPPSPHHHASLPPQPPPPETADAATQVELRVAVSASQTDEQGPPPPPAAVAAAAAATPPASDEFWTNLVAAQLEAREAAVRREEERLTEARRELVGQEGLLEKRSRDGTEAALQCERAQVELEALRQRDADSQALLRELTRRCDALERAAIDAEDERDDLATARARVSGGLGEAQKEVERLRRENARLADDLDLDRELAAKEVQQLRQGADGRVRSATLEAAAVEERCRRELAELRGELADAKAAAAGREAKGAAAAAEAQAARAEAALAKGRVEQLEADAAALRAAHAVAQDAMLSDYNRQLGVAREAQAGRDAKKAEADALRAELAQLRKQVMRGLEAEEVLGAARDEAVAMAAESRRDAESLKHHAVQQEGRMLLEIDRLKRQQQQQQ
eukprot:Rhum_TRINITY_DN14257_c8_g2::Rhum_TRINITY_DN14257_c8_g2_i1::g.76064::m.76064